MNPKKHLCANSHCIVKTEQYYCPKHLKEYNKTWYYGISFSSNWPENVICSRPIKLFGTYIFTLMHIAKPNYKWSKI